MADSLTDTVLKRRSAAKTGGFALAGVGLGLLLKAAFGFEPADAFFSSIESLTDWFSGVKTWLDANPDVRGWIVGPVALGLLFLGFANIGWLRRNLLDRFFPDPPPFVRSDLDEARRREQMLSLEGPPLSFVGREAELDELARLLDKGGERFVWRTVTGPSGIGKTRLGLEWLNRARAAGWDWGIVDRDDLAKLAEWAARRPTALVIDEASRSYGERLGEVLTALGRAASRHPIRVLVIDQMRAVPAISVGEDRQMVRAAEMSGSLRVGALRDPDIVALRSAAGHSRLDEETLIRESAGRPRAALILMNAPSAERVPEALLDWADGILPGLADEGRALPVSLAGPLFLSALAGPIETDEARAIFGPLSIEALLRFYLEAEPDALERSLPPIVPDDLAQELLLRLLPRLDLRLREKAVDRMIATAPALVEMRLGSIWRNCPDLRDGERASQRAKALEWLQTRLDDARPERVAAVHERLREIANMGLQKSITPGECDEGLAELIALVSTRPFDPVVRRFEAPALVNFGMRYGEWGRLDEVERLLARCDRLAENPLFSDVTEIRIGQARGLSNAICAYVDAGRPDGGEIWADRLAAIVDDPRFADTPEMREIEAAGAALAIVAFGLTGNAAQMDPWKNRIEILAEDPRFNRDFEIMREVVKAAMNATSQCEPDRSDKELDKWLKFVVNIAGRAEFRDLDIVKRIEVQAHVNAMRFYGNRRDFENMERLGRDLIGIIEDPRFEGDAEIRLYGVRGDSNSINCYAKAREIPDSGLGSEQIADGIARWGRRMLAVAHDVRFANVEFVLLEISTALMNATDACEHFDESGLAHWGAELTAFREKAEAIGSRATWLNIARATVNLMLTNGRGRLFKEMRHWGERLETIMCRPQFSADPDFAEVDASGAVNAMVTLVDGGRGDWPVYNHWRKHFARLARRFPVHAQIQEWGHQIGLSVLDQRRDGYPFGDA
jgi:hypothetical protein